MDIKRAIEKALDTLSKREAKVISLRFFYGLTLEETRKKIKGVKSHRPVTRERVRQIESHALKKLRHPSRSRLLREIWDELQKLP